MMLATRLGVLQAAKSIRSVASSSAARSAARQGEDYDEFSQQADLKRRAEQKKRQSEDETDRLRDQLLEAGLQHVPKLGWTTKALQAAAADLGLPAVTSGLFAGGGVDLVHFHCRKSNERLEVLMKDEVRSLADRGERLRIRPFIRDKVEKRLRMNAAFMPRWAEALGLAAQPANLPTTLQLDADLMDCMWHHAGDRAVDHNWYTKRLSLAAIYKATEMAMIEDRSEDFGQTWAFLDRRFEDELQFAKSIGNLYDLQNVAAGVATTIHNMIGLPRR